jgi:SLIT-ROBO Rho GTPase activating protein
MQLVDDTKDEARHRLTIAEVLGNYSNISFNAHSNHLQKVSKKCREIGVLAQGEVVRVIDEMNVSMKTYQACFEQCQEMAEKVREFEQKLQSEDISTRKRRSLQKNLLKANSKHETLEKKCNRARNEYLLCIDAANASLHKYFADDLSDIIGCMDVGTDYWSCLLLDNIIAARKVACQNEMNSLAQLTNAISMLPQCDKQRFYESHNNTFMLPKCFEFRLG